MNCKQAEKLLPLYVGRDLDEKRGRSVSEHLQSCAACARVANEYRDAFQLTQQVATPVFSNDVYARMRRNVLKEIETESARPAMPQLFFGWFRPRMTWAVASALVVAFVVLAFYFAANRRAGNQPLANNHGVLSRNDLRGSPVEQSPLTTPTASPVNPDKEKPSELKQKNVRSGSTGRQTRRVHESISAAMKVSPDRREVAEPNSFPLSDSSQEQPLRVEMQTKDPNIRIIWFTQPATKPALSNSKGT